jgi:hypothetical protein
MASVSQTVEFQWTENFSGQNSVRVGGQGQDVFRHLPGIVFEFKGILERETGIEPATNSLEG